MAIEQEQEQSGEASRMRTLSGKDLLIQLPYLQRLLQRLVDCRPGGPCVHDVVVQVCSLAILSFRCLSSTAVQGPVCAWRSRSGQRH